MIDDVRNHAPRVLILGGGGYHPWSVTRAWTGLWARLNNAEIPNVLPEKAQDVLKNIIHPAFAAHPAVYPDAFTNWCRHLEDMRRPGNEMPDLAILTTELTKHNFKKPKQYGIKPSATPVPVRNSFRPRSIWA